MIATTNVSAAWGEDAPGWVTILAEACNRSSQKAAAGEIGYSATVVNQVLKGTYTGDLTAVQSAVEGAFMHAVVACPVIGELPTHRCLEHQRRKFAATNPQRVKLFRACRSGCPHSRLKVKE